MVCRLVHLLHVRVVEQHVGKWIFMHHVRVHIRWSRNSLFCTLSSFSLQQSSHKKLGMGFRCYWLNGYLHSICYSLVTKCKPCYQNLSRTNFAGTIDEDGNACVFCCIWTWQHFTIGISCYKDMSELMDW